MVLKLWTKMPTANQIAGFFKVLYLKKEVRDQVDFLHVDKHQSFLQVDNIDFGGRGQVCSKYSK